jgi:hypothetical protein
LSYPDALDELQQSRPKSYFDPAEALRGQNFDTRILCDAKTASSKEKEKTNGLIYK